MRAVVGTLAEELGAELERAAAGPDPRADLVAIADAFRAFARRHPRAYGLLFTEGDPEIRLPPELGPLAVETLLRTVARLVPEEDVLDAAGLLTAYAHGFVSMELAGAFQLGGDVDRAYERGVGTLVGALAAWDGGPDRDGPPA